MDWEIVQSVGTSLTCGTLEIFGHKLHGEDLERLAMDLCETRLWVNNAGRCFARLLETTTISYRQTIKMFDWEKYGVKNPERVAKELKAELDRVAAKEKFDRDNYGDKKSGESSRGQGSTNMPQEDTLETLIREWRHPVSPQQFEILGSQQRYAFDLAKKPLNLKATNFAVGNQLPCGVKVNVSNGEKKFDTKDWFFIKIENASTGEKSLFAFYDGCYGVHELVGDDLCFLPHKSNEKCTSNFQMILADLRGYGIVYGFCYTCIDAKEKDKKGIHHQQQTSSSSSSSSTTYINLSPEYQKLFVQKWRHPIATQQFEMQWSPQDYVVDFEKRMKLRPTDVSNLAAQNRHPCGVKVCIIDGEKKFDTKSWFFIKIENEYTSEESLFAFYDGLFDKFSSRGDWVRLPHSSKAKCSSNFPFALVNLRGYGVVYGFCYKALKAGVETSRGDDEMTHIKKCKLQVSSRQFQMEKSPQGYAVDLDNRLKFKTTKLGNLAVQNQQPYVVKVYVSARETTFDKNNWSFIKIENESNGDISLFAFYEGSLYKFGSVSLPHKPRATCTSNFPFHLVNLRGYGLVYGFC